jgi:hypothetical protein
MWVKVEAAFQVAGEIGDAAAALVLLAYANRSSRAGEAWPSTASLRADTGMSSRSIDRARAVLVERGHLVDTGRRRGATGRVIVYDVLPNSADVAQLGAGETAQDRQVIAPNLQGNSVNLTHGTSKGTPQKPTPPARASAREVGGLCEIDPAVQAWHDRVVIKNVRKDGERAFAAARHEGTCAEDCDHPSVNLGDAIYHDAETGSTRHQSCRFDDDAHRLLLDPRMNDRAGVAAEHLGPCGTCGEVIERGDAVLWLDGALVHNLERCYPE